MENREAIEMLKGVAVYADTEYKKALILAISALEKREQSNAQKVNSMHRSRPNALESLNILEQAKDDKGCVPMSLVRQAFRNILEHDRWIPVTEKEDEQYGF